MPSEAGAYAWCQFIRVAGVEVEVGRTKSQNRQERRGRHCYRRTVITSAEIARMWKNVFGVFAPLGYVCRGELPARWLRIHSLPESKRYPETEAEYRELLRRHNEVATTVLGEDEQCILFATTFSNRRAGPDIADMPAVDDAKFFYVPELSTKEPTEQIWANVSAASISWRRSLFDSLITAVADESVGPVLFANVERRAAYAPYDGGADLFVDTSETVALLKKKWRGWLSVRVDGL